MWLRDVMLIHEQPESRPALPLLAQSFVPYGPKLGRAHSSYFMNTTGFIRGSLDFYNITPSSLESSKAPWKSHAQSFMSDINITELSDKLGSWNWSAATNMSWSVVDYAPVAVEGVSERIGMIHVGCLCESLQPTLTEMVVFREGSISRIQRMRTKCDLSLMACTFSQTAPFMVSLNRVGEWFQSRVVILLTSCQTAHRHSVSSCYRSRGRSEQNGSCHQT